MAFARRAGSGVPNRLTGAVVYDHTILEQGQKAVGLCVDIQKNTFWLFTALEIFEIVVRDEDRDVWKIMLDQQQFSAALQHAHLPEQKDAVAIATGDYLIKKGSYSEAATVYGKSSKFPTSSRVGLNHVVAADDVVSIFTK